MDWIASTREVLNPFDKGEFLFWSQGLSLCTTFLFRGAPIQSILQGSWCSGRSCSFTDVPIGPIFEACDGFGKIVGFFNGIDAILPCHGDVDGRLMRVAGWAGLELIASKFRKFPNIASLS